MDWSAVMVLVAVVSWTIIVLATVLSLSHDIDYVAPRYPRDTSLRRAQRLNDMGDDDDDDR